VIDIPACCASPSLTAVNSSAGRVAAVSSLDTLVVRHPDTDLPVAVDTPDLLHPDMAAAVAEVAVADTASPHTSGVAAAEVAAADTATPDTSVEAEAVVVEEADTFQFLFDRRRFLCQCQFRYSVVRPRCLRLPE
jgi:hypothetical protein